MKTLDALTFLILTVGAGITVACKSDDPASPSTSGKDASTLADAGLVGEADFAATDSDFDCLKDWTKVRKFYITNKLGKTSDTLAVANAGSGTYPVGTVIQLVPTEAMVKRAPGFSPESNDWEFFFLDVTAAGSRIVHRGTIDVLNAFNLNCLDCHKKAEPQYDFVCETGHGCDPLPLTTEIITSLQDADPRCAVRGADGG